MNRENKIYRKYFIIGLVFNIMVCLPTFVNGQNINQHPSIFFISDCQEPLQIEKVFRKTYNNSEGREMLFKEIINKNEGFVFMLGDLVGKASKNDEWKNLDDFIKTLKNASTSVYAIPGNHEYLLNSTEGISNFQKRFPGLPLDGYLVRTDSMAFVMLNSNFGELTATILEKQQLWYKSVMDSLDQDEAVKVIIVCTHHAPFSNSTVVGSSVKVQEAFVPGFKNSPKAKLFITGHSHNLECFDATNGKRFLVIGGGGGLDQPLYANDKQKHKDLISQEIKPRFFYMVLQRKGNLLEVKIEGFSRELLPVKEITLLL